VRLILTVSNIGPSDILNTDVIIKFPRPARPGAYWLYPVSLEAVATVSKRGNLCIEMHSVKSELPIRPSF